MRRDFNGYNVGDRKLVRKFLLLPCWLYVKGSDDVRSFRWLEFATIEYIVFETYLDWTVWKAIYFVD